MIRIFKSSCMDNHYQLRMASSQKLVRSWDPQSQSNNKMNSADNLADSERILLWLSLERKIVWLTPDCSL